MSSTFDHRYPSVDDLRAAARRRIPGFVFDFLDGGCNDDVNLRRNVEDFRSVELRPRYLRPRGKVTLETELFGRVWGAPFGICPVGLQGLVWPGACEALAVAATAHRLPFILSTTTTADPETIGRITGGTHWFQFYVPVEADLREALLRRVEDSGCRVLVLLADVPVFGYRPRDIRNRFAVPPRIGTRTVLQMLARPAWGMAMLRRSAPDGTAGVWCSVWIVLISASFGVVLEGPMGAVTFWVLLGIASAATLPEPAPAAEAAPDEANAALRAASPAA